ncbi:class I SAM-dependent methyltransferase [Calothrix sp. UHCC 0171]|uniref:class I SAM-dependent methyltransferase n=1 Tax=Calothrix sp. UHCC 0171 TaxID=3110245 RepID=UPI002B20C3DB|nr:methyltransferase domain-containing protein [Calothrix sp. UHCC 0171]MEA5570530.1 methyltransferase domain-containing protein [Calothrix sp. UHCC 0171]
MAVPASELLEKIRQQFDSAPYPCIPVEDSAKDNSGVLHLHSLVTPYYLRNQKFIDTKDKLILDAGCGTGYKSLTLAFANPGAKVIGVDLSEPSIQLAEKRLQYHSVENFEFHTLLLEDLPKLGLEFDYINCDDVLYLLPDAVAGLQAMKSVLKPDGIIRVNLHSQLQREWYYRAQNLCKFMGLMDGNPEATEIATLREIMKALKNDVRLKVKTWNPINEEDDGSILANHLLVGDKGSTIPEFFSLLRNAGLEFVSMVNWQRWDVMDLFKDPDDLPAFLALSFPELSQEEQLHLFEQLHPIHRLIDLWCGHPQQQQLTPISEWADQDWENVSIHLHPVLKTPDFREDLIESVSQMRPLVISKHLSLIDQVVSIDSSMALSLVPLLEQPQSMISLVERWKQVRPIDPVTMKAVPNEQAFYLVKLMILRLEGLGYVMVERN